MAAPSYVVRCMAKSEIPNALALWKETGYHEGNHTFETFYEVDSEGFWVAATEEGDIIGLCSAIIYHENFVFVGAYVVKKEYRGQGIGKKVWDACLDHIGGKNAALNAVPGKIQLYRDRGGFPYVETKWYTLYCDAESVDPSVLVKDIEGIQLKPITDEDLPLVLDYDSKLIGFKRDRAVTLTTKEPESTSYLAIQNGRCVGYGTYHLGCQGYGLIGPLYADNQDIAEAILRRLIETLTEAKGFAIGIINENENAKAILAKLSERMKSIVCPRAYRVNFLDVDVSKVYGHLSMNFSPY